MQLGLKFPKAGAPEAVIDTGAYEERQLTAADKDTYPLVIRMETVTDKGRSDAHTLQVRALLSRQDSYLICPVPW